MLTQFEQAIAHIKAGEIERGNSSWLKYLTKPKRRKSLAVDDEVRNKHRAKKILL